MISQSTSFPESLIGDSTTVGAIALTCWAAWKLYRVIESNRRSSEADYGRRLDRQRRNVSRLHQYAGHLYRLIPADVETPPWPKLEPEADDAPPPTPPEPDNY